MARTWGAGRLSVMELSGWRMQERGNGAYERERDDSLEASHG